MKNLSKVLIISSFLLINCSKKESDLVVANADLKANASLAASDLFGTWKFKNYADNKKISYEISLEFKNERSTDGKLLLSGRSSVNFYTATFEQSFQDKTLKIGAIGRTKIAGTPEANTFENTYLEKLGKALSYDLKDKMLLIYTNEPTKEIMYFEKNP